MPRAKRFYQCMVYMDLNMFRAGAVSHPSQWDCAGYSEIQNPKQRYRLIDLERLQHLLQMGSVEDLKKAHGRWVEESLRNKPHFRESKWTQSIAVGNEAFVKNTKEELRIRAKYRRIDQEGSSFQLREKQDSYNDDF